MPLAAQHAWGPNGKNSYLAGGFLPKGWNGPALTLAVAGADPLERG